MTKTSKPWYKRKRIWGVMIFLLLIYFCLVPSRLKISPETTGITGPLTKDGRVDYFAAFEKLYIDKLNPPEENGLRYMIAACGPTILERMAMVDEVPWEQMPTHQYSKNWFENYWLPLCAHLYIDPYQRPMFYDSRQFHSYFDNLKKEQKKAAEAAGENFIDDDPKGEKLSELHKTLTTAPWKHEDHPEVVPWLQQRSPLLDYYGVCVRMPNYACWRQTGDKSGCLFAVLLPDVQAQRGFARDLCIRVAERVERGDIDGAWYDVMSMKHVARHYGNDTFLVTNLVGHAIEGMANASANLILKYGNPTEEQLDRFARDLDNLQRVVPFSLSMTAESYMVYQFLDCLGQKAGRIYLIDVMSRPGLDSKQRIHSFYILSRLPFDANIAGKRLSKLFGEYGLKDGGAFKRCANPALRHKYVEEMDRVRKQLEEKLQGSQWYRIPLIHTRSQLLAEYIFVHMTPAFNMASANFDRTEAQNELLRIAIALERYKLAHGDYPKKLDQLVPECLFEIPLDPCTTLATFTYKLNPEEGCPYLIYSYGRNGKDDGGVEDPRNIDGDIVFKR